MKKVFITLLAFVLTTGIVFAKTTNFYDKSGNKTGSYSGKSNSISNNTWLGKKKRKTRKNSFFLNYTLLKRGL